MKRSIFLSLFILATVTAFAWSSRKYNVTYDQNFNPIVSMDLTNSTGKTIADIDFIIFIKKEGASQWDVMAVDELHIIQTVNMTPSSSRTFRLKPKVPKGWYVSSAGVEKIRYSDGTVTQY